VKEQSWISELPPHYNKRTDLKELHTQQVDFSELVLVNVYCLITHSTLIVNAYKSQLPENRYKVIGFASLNS
jgi:hypothetical protein